MFLGSKDHVSGSNKLKKRAVFVYIWLNKTTRIVIVKGFPFNEKILSGIETESEIDSVRKFFALAYKNRCINI